MKNIYRDDQQQFNEEIINLKIENENLKKKNMKIKNIKVFKNGILDIQETLEIRINEELVKWQLMG